MELCKCVLSRMLFLQFTIFALLLTHGIRGQQHSQHQFNNKRQNIQTANGIGELDYDYQDAPSVSERYVSPRNPAIGSRPKLPFTAAADIQKPTPVAILKQINRHNEDGSYTYGFEGADGSFKIETKSAQGEVFGKYGYVDDGGKLRVVEYGANKYGFRPSGEGITVPPPVLINETDTKNNLDDEENIVNDSSKRSGPIFQPAIQKQRKPAASPLLSESVPIRVTSKATLPKRRPIVQTQFTGYEGNVSPNIYREESQPIFPNSLFSGALSVKSPKRVEEDRFEPGNVGFVPGQNNLQIDFEPAQTTPRPYTSPYPSASFSNQPKVPTHRARDSGIVHRSEDQPNNGATRSSYGRQQVGSILDELLKQYSLPPSPETYQNGYSFH